jgi:hypothetical protein
MRRSFLDSLIGMDVEEARQAVVAAGLHAYIIDPRVDPCLDGRGLVMLRQRNGIVVEARPGVQSEVTED